MDETFPSQETWRALYPFTSRLIDVPGGRYHYVDEGQGEPVVFVHGNPTWSFHWRKLILALRDRYRVLAVDHLGCGLSDCPAEWGYRLADHVDNLGTFLSELDLRYVTIVGHDWGGAISLGAALANPERIARIVLLNTGAWPPDSIPWRIDVCRTPWIGRLGVQGMNLFLLAAFRMAFAGKKRLSREERLGYLAPYRNWSHRKAIYEFVRDIPSSPAHPTWSKLAEIERRLPELSASPMQLIWGLKDWCFTPACLKRFRTVFPHAKVCEIPWAGHWVVEEAYPEVLSSLEMFLGQSALPDNAVPNNASTTP